MGRREYPERTKNSVGAQEPLEILILIDQSFMSGADPIQPWMPLVVDYELQEISGAVVESLIETVTDVLATIMSKKVIK
jgi:hypothetical protein